MKRRLTYRAVRGRKGWRVEAVCYHLGKVVTHASGLHQLEAFNLAARMREQFIQKHGAENYVES